MEDTEDDARYPSNPYGVTQGYGMLRHPKPPDRSASYPQQDGNQYVDDDDEEGEEEVDEEEDDDNNEDNDTRRIDKIENYEDDDDNDGDDDDDDEEEEDGDEDEDDDEHNGYRRRIGGVDIERHQKKRKLKSLLSSYELAPRVAASAAAVASTSMRSFVGRNALAEWTEHETFVLLDAWGDRFLKHGRKSLRSEEWQEVTEKVTEESKIERSDTQCRNRLDTMKKKYKKEKIKLAEGRGTTSKWVYFRKMDVLMSSSPKQPGLPCGMDSGEYVFMNPKFYLDHANGLDEMRDSPSNSESEGGEDDSDGLLPKRTRMDRDRDDGASFRLLADSIQKFGEIYEKIENSKRQQMLELEKMRMDFRKELDFQERKILERAHAEIAKIRQGDNEENDLSAENNISG